MSISAAAKKIKDSNSKSSIGEDLRNAVSKEGLKKASGWAIGAAGSALKSGIKSGGAFAARRILGDTLGGFVGEKLFGDSKSVPSILSQIRDGIRYLGKTNSVVAKVLTDEIKLQRENSVDKAVERISNLFAKNKIDAGSTGEIANVGNALSEAHGSLLRGEKLRDVIDDVLDSVQKKYSEEHNGDEVPKEILKEITALVRELAKEVKVQSDLIDAYEVKGDAKSDLIRDISSYEENDTSSRRSNLPYEPIVQISKPIMYKRNVQEEELKPVRYRDSKGRFAKNPDLLKSEEDSEESSISSENAAAAEYAKTQKDKKSTTEKKSMWQMIIEKFLPKIFAGFVGLKSLFSSGITGLAKNILGGKLISLASTALALGKNALGLGAKAAAGGTVVAAEAVAAGTAGAGLLGKGKSLMSKVGLTKGGLAGMALGGVTTYAGEKLADSGHDIIGDIVKDAGNGAMAGGLLGPWGALAGAVGGTAYGIYDNWNKITGPSNKTADNIAAKSQTSNHAKESPTIVNNNTTNNYNSKTKQDKTPINASRNAEPSIQRMTDRAYTPSLV